MKILILSATQLEIQPFLLTLESIPVKPDVLIGGLGTTVTAYHLTLALVRVDTNQGGRGGRFLP